MSGGSQDASGTGNGVGSSHAGGLWNTGVASEAPTGDATQATGGRQDESDAGSRVTSSPFGDCGRTVAASPQDFHAAITEAAQWRCGPQEAVAAAPQESSATAGSTWLNDAVAAAPQESHATTVSANQESTANIEQMLQNIMTILEGFGERLSRIEDAVQRR